MYFQDGSGTSTQNVQKTSEMKLVTNYSTLRVDENKSMDEAVPQLLQMDACSHLSGYV